MPVRASNTMVEGLTSIMSDIASMKAMPDGDLQFLIQLETMILKKLREPIDSMAGQMGGPGGMPEGAGPMPGMGPGSTPPPPGPPPGPPQGQPGGPPRGMMAGAGAPNPDELRRLLTGGPGAG